MGRSFDFYKGKIKHPRRVTLEDIWNWNDGQLEFEHTYIQWLFPLTERSPSEPDSPILTENDIHRFNKDPELKEKLKVSFKLLLRFYGFELSYGSQDGVTPIILPAQNFDERSKRWLNANNHNYLRITRILKSLTQLGLTHEAIEFFAALQRVYIKNPNRIGSYTYDYWKKALGQKPIKGKKF